MEDQSTAAQPTPLEAFEKRLRAARWLSRQGYGIVLLPVPVPGDCGCPASSSTRRDPATKGRCKSPGKHPLGQDWEHHAAHTPDEASALVANPAVRALRQFGIFPEPGSRVLVLDEDVPGWLDDLAARKGLTLPPTFGVWTSVDTTTGRRKRHLYHRLADGIDPASVPRKFGGGDIRVDGSGQVVGPWSRHASGVDYEPFGPAEVAELPQEWVDALREDSKSQNRAADAAAGPGEEGWTLAKGARWPFLVRRSVYMRKIGIRNPELESAMQRLNADRCSPPHAESEIARLCAYVDEKVEEPPPGFTLSVPGSPGYEGAAPVLRVVRREEYEYEVEPPKVGEFPLPPDPVAVSASLGAAMVVNDLSRRTTASEAGILASLLAIWSGMWGSHFDLYEEQPTNLFAVLVGDTASGRKGTTTRSVWRTLEESFSPQSATSVAVPLYESRWDGLASGQGFLRQMKDARVKQGVAIEEEFENTLRGARSSANYASTLGTTIQKAFDGAMLQHVTVRGSLRVEPGYTVGVLGNITREVLHTVLPPEFTSGGFANRILWVPVTEREGTARGGPVDPQTAAYLRECRKFSVATPRLTLHPDAESVIRDYYEHLRALTGTQSQFARRLHVIAARIAVVHAMLDRVPEADVTHVLGGIALAEYCRRGLIWTFTDETGDEWLDAVVENLRAAGPEGLPTKAVARILQNHAPRIERVKKVGVASGLVRLEKVPSRGGRPSIVWRHAQVDPLKDFIRSQTPYKAPHTPSASVKTQDVSVEQSVEIEKTANNPLTTSEQSSNDSQQTLGLEPSPVPEWRVACLFYADHTSVHFRLPDGRWTCRVCDPEVPVE